MANHYIRSFVMPFFISDLLYTILADLRSFLESEKLWTINLLRKKIDKNMSPEAIADALEDELENILPFYEVMTANPELSDEEVYRTVYPDDES